MNIIHTDGSHPDFVKLTNLLDDEYYERFGEIALQYRQYNTITDIYDAYISYDDNKPVACGSFKRYNKDTTELKRIYVLKEYRRKHIAQELVNQCEAEALKQGYASMILETGAEMSEAIALYEKSGYSLIDNFGQFEGDNVCVCMKKQL